MGLILRYESSPRWLQQQIAVGAFGDLVSIRARRNCSRSSFAAIADRIHTVHRTLIHDIDLLLWLSSSRVTSVMAMDVRLGDHLDPQGCFALLRLANGAVAQLERAVGPSPPMPPPTCSPTTGRAVSMPNWRWWVASAPPWPMTGGSLALPDRRKPTRHGALPNFH